MRCSRTAKAIGSSFPRTERVETKPCGRGFSDADLSREMQESRHYCRDSRVNQIKAALFLARARVIDLHRLLFLGRPDFRTIQRPYGCCRRSSLLRGFVVSFPDSLRTPMC